MEATERKEEKKKEKGSGGDKIETNEIDGWIEKETEKQKTSIRGEDEEGEKGRRFAKSSILRSLAFSQDFPPLLLRHYSVVVERNAIPSAVRECVNERHGEANWRGDGRRAERCRQRREELTVPRASQSDKDRARCVNEAAEGTEERWPHGGG